MARSGAGVDAAARAAWALPAAIACWGALLAWGLDAALRRTGGEIGYALDDAYIHVAMGRVMAEHGFFGVTPHAYAAASSSPLWLILLAGAHRVVGLWLWTPLVLNVVGSVLLLWVVAGELRRARADLPEGWRFAALLALVLLLPLLTMVLAGMEHVLQALVAVVFVFAIARVLSGPPDWRSRDAVLALALAPVVTALRYEGLFLVAAAGFLLLVRRRTAYAFALGLLAAVPPVVVALDGLAHGAFALPNSVLLKASANYDTLGWLGRVAKAGAALVPVAPLLTAMPWFRQRPNVALALVGATLAASVGMVIVLSPRIEQAAIYGTTVALGLGPAWLWARRFEARGAWLAYQAALLLLVLAFVQHSLMAQNGGFYRYQAYLVALAVAALAAALASDARTLGRPRWPSAGTAKGVAVLLLLLVVPVAGRGALGTLQAPIGVGNIHDQQWQMGLFAREAYAGQTVAVHDLGAVALLCDCRVFDLYGLASQEVAQAKWHQDYTTQRIDEWTRRDDVRIAMIYERSLSAQGGIPASWVEVGTWRIQHNVVAGSSQVHFYAVDPAEAEPLKQHLREFSARLPASVIEGGPYTRPS